MIQITKILREGYVSSHLMNHNFCKQRLSAYFCYGHEPGVCTTCDLTFHVTSYSCEPITHSLPRAGRSDLELIDNMVIWLESHYKMVDFLYQYTDRPNPIMEACIELKFSRGPNQTMLHGRNLLPGKSMPISSDLPTPHSRLVRAYRSWDRKVFPCAKEPFFFSHKHGNGTPSLKYLLQKRYSAYNMAFGNDEEGRPRSMQTRSNLYKNHKLLKLHQEFSRETSKLSRQAKSLLKKYLKEALVLLYTEFLKVTQFFGIHGWRYTKEDFVRYVGVKFSTSSGISLQPSMVRELCKGIRVVKGSSGYKKEFVEQFFDEMDKLQAKFDQGEVPELQRSPCSIIMKMEVVNSWDKATSEEREAMMSKCRHFFIPFCVENMQASCISKLRQGFERGDVIRIGMRWWQGGALHLANILKYDPEQYPDQVFSMGDFRKYDKGVNRFLLNLYYCECQRYMSKNFVGPDRHFFDFLVIYLSDCLGTKITHMISDIWVVMDGVMPSGHFDTSHGDSWIVVFLYCLMLVSQFRSGRGSIIKEYVLSKRIVIVVYGDDHVISCPSEVYDYVGEHAFSNFVRVFGMEIRDIKKAPFLTTVGPYGEIVTEGVVFLQRYFIESNFSRGLLKKKLPKILPWRPAHKNIQKLAFGGGAQRTLFDVLLSVVGHAYDTMGTNEYAYNFCTHVYQEIYNECLLHHSDIEGELADYIASMSTLQRQDITKLMMKSNITEAEISQFPTLEELQQRHIQVDPFYHKTTLDFGSQGMFYHMEK